MVQVKKITIPADLTNLDIKVDVYDAWKLWKTLYNYGDYAVAIRKIQEFYFLQNGWVFLPNQIHAANINGYLLPGEVAAAAKGDTGLAAWNVKPGSAPLF